MKNKIYKILKILLVTVVLCCGMFNKTYACAGVEDSCDICFGENCCVCGKEADVMFDSKAYCFSCVPKCEVCGRTAIDQLEGHLYCYVCLPNNCSRKFEVAEIVDIKPASVHPERKSQTFAFQNTYFVQQNQVNAFLQKRMGACPQVFGRCVQCGRQKGEVMFRMIPYCFDCR